MRVVYEIKWHALRTLSGPWRCAAVLECRMPLALGQEPMQGQHLSLTLCRTHQVQPCGSFWPRSGYLSWYMVMSLAQSMR